MEQDFSSHHVLSNVWKSLKGVPLLAWLFLFFGLMGLLYTQGHALEVQVPGTGVGLWASIAAGLHKVPWLGLIREVSMALVISFCLAVFLEEPLRAQTITRVGRDIAPFLIAALTVPEMRYKMRQICEFGVIRKDSKLLLWIEEPESDAPKDRYTLKVQMRSRFCNISNTVQRVVARVAVDEETNGKILGLFMRPVNVHGVSETHWSSVTEKAPPPIDGRRTIEKELDFPNCNDWERSYIEVTGEYQEDINLIGNVGRSLLESLWPLIGIEVECLGRPKDISIKVRIPFHTEDLKQIGDSDRWISSVALLPGERVDIVLVRSTSAPPPTETLLITQK